MNLEREAPHSDEAEISVLGAMMIEVDAADIGLELLSEEDFYQPAHRLVFRAITLLREGGMAPDAMSVREQLRKLGKYSEAGGDEYLAHIIEIVPTTANIRYHAQTVIDTAIRRRVIRAATNVVVSAYENTDIGTLLDDAEQAIMSATQDRLEHGDGLVKTSAFIRNVLDLVLEGKVNSIPSGFRGLDDVTGGFRPGELTILAARPSMGKSALAGQIASNVAIATGAPVAFFTLEMVKEIVLQRLLAISASVDLSILVQGRKEMLTTRDIQALIDSSEKFQKAPIYIDDTPGLTVWELRSRARRLKQRHGIQLIVVDYLQLMTGKGDNRTQEVGSISRGLKRLAGELNVPVLALSQLSRGVEAREDKRPRLSDLRDSGEIEQDADAVFFIYRHAYYDPTGARSSGQSALAELHIAKQRNGPSGININLSFNQKLVRFGDWSEVKMEQEGW